MALITCRDGAFGYEGSTVVEGLNFTVEQGDYLCIVGENGSGKSTLMKGLLGLIKPMEGEITGDGLRPNEIGYLPQQTAAQKDFPASVWEVASSGRLTAGGLLPFYSKADRMAVKHNLELLGIYPLRRKCFRELSGGQQQRVLLCRALCAADRVVLLDEPVSGLDPLVTAELYATIENLNRQGITVIMVSHDIRAAVQYASHILHLQNRQAFFGPKADYMETEQGRKFLGGDAR